MLSRARRGDDASAPRRALSGYFAGVIKTFIGLAVLGGLFYGGKLDLRILSGLADKPGVVLVCIGLVFLNWPLGTLRWQILLRALGVAVPFGRLFHIFSIATSLNMFMLGIAGGDGARIWYVWQTAGRGTTARIAVAVFADRLFGFISLIAISCASLVFNWCRIRHIPALSTLATSVLIALGLIVIGGAALLLAPALAHQVPRVLARWPRLTAFVTQAHDILIIFRRNPITLIGALMISLLMQIPALIAVAIIADTLQIGMLQPADYFFATPLAFVTNSVPLTPNGIGIGEAAFDQICRWLEPAPSGAAYSSIFFCLRGISLLIATIGIISFIKYGHGKKPVDE